MVICNPQRRRHVARRGPGRAIALGIVGLAVSSCSATTTTTPLSAPAVVPPMPPATTAPATTAPLPPATTAPLPPATVPAPAPIAWEPCGGDFTCGTLDVPLDYGDALSETLRLDVIRLKAKDPASGSGPLFMNPGGPGGSARQFLRSAGAMFNDRFDVYAFDPRGVSGTHRLTCDPAAEAIFRSTESSPDTPTEQQTLDDAAKAVAEACTRSSGALLAHMTTDDAARDLDRFREAVGSPTLSWFGLSYGTLLGLRYAELYPTRVRAMAIDGVVDPTKRLEEMLTDQARLVGAALDRGLARCRSSGRCGSIDPVTALADLRTRVEHQPINTPAGKLGSPELAVATLSAGYSPSSMDRFTNALAAPDDATRVAGMLALFKAYTSAASFGTYLGVECTDGPRPGDATSYHAMAARMEAAVPHLGAPIANELLPCAFWPAPAGPPPRPVAARGAPPILVLGTTGDPATPYTYSESVASALTDGTLLTYDGEGHTATFRSPCALAAVKSYLATVTPPSKGTRCA